MKDEGEQIIESVEKDYWQLKKDFPDMDEHWYLANTWIKRYEDTEAGKEKGRGSMNFISYQDTFSFSVLDSPKSIRAFAFFLLYKEGFKKAEKYVYEFEDITQELGQYQKNNTLFPVYKQKNPKTYEKAQIENDPDFEGAPMNLYGYIKGLEYNYKNLEETKDSENRDNDIGKETWSKAEQIYPYSYIFSSIEESPVEFEEKINRGVLSTESYNIKSFEKIWELINLSNDKILGINWDEGKSARRDEIEKKIIDIGFKVKPMQNPMSIKFNCKLTFGDIIEGSITLMKDGMLYCSFYFVYKNAEDLIKFLEQKCGKSLNLRDDMIREFKYDWMIGDIALLVEVSKISKFASMGFIKNVDFAKKM
ncbi:MAG: hypothetical protein KAU07_00595 [Candidatus Andersenbacteria bacterium]|nr:hypothetical protein [Candidatus Andersenbacteria bacterium]